MPCTCKILYRDNDIILLKYQHGCIEHEDWCYNKNYKKYIEATTNVLMCECGRRAFIEEAVHSTTNNKVKSAIAKGKSDIKSNKKLMEFYKIISILQELIESVTQLTDID